MTDNRSKDLSFTETFGCTPVAGDPLPSNPELQRLRELAEMLPHRMAAKDVLWAVEYIEASNEEGRLAEAEIERLQRERDEAKAALAAASSALTSVGGQADRLRDFVNGLLGLVQLIDMRDDLPREIGEAMSNNHRYLDALHYMNGLPPPRHADETTPSLQGRMAQYAMKLAGYAQHLGDCAMLTSSLKTAKCSCGLHGLMDEAQRLDLAVSAVETK